MVDGWRERSREICCHHGKRRVEGWVSEQESGCVSIRVSKKVTPLVRLQASAFAVCYETSDYHP